MYDLNEIRQRISLVKLAEEAGARFKDAHHLSSHCPLPRHAGDRSSQAFTIYDHEQKWKCHSSCPSDASGGDIFKFYMAWQEVDYKTAVTELAKRAGMANGQASKARSIALIPASSPSPLPAEPSTAWQDRAAQFMAYCQHNLTSSAGAVAREYLEKERGLWDETWQLFQLGYNPSNLYDAPERWGLNGNKVWLPRGIVIPGVHNARASYIKIRRPLPEHTLGRYIGPWSEKDSLPEVKFGGPRGGKSVLFGQDQFARLPVLLLVEGEWDAMLVSQFCDDMCDVSTLGGAQSQFDTFDLAVLIRYQAVLVVHDADAAGDRGRQYIAKLHTQGSRVRSIPPPCLNNTFAHDLTDFWKSGGNLRAWVAGHVAKALDESLVQASTCPINPTIERWRRIAAWARHETGFRLPDSSAEKEELYEIALP